MRQIKNRFLLLVAALVIVAPAFAGDDSDMASRLAQWEKAYNSGDMAAVAAFYAEDGCRMPPNTATVQGRKAILAALEAGREAGIRGVKLALTMASSSGDSAQATGTYKILDDHGMEVDHGKWMNFSRKVDGHWLTACDMYSSDLPLPMDEEEDD